MSRRGGEYRSCYPAAGGYWSKLGPGSRYSSRLGRYWSTLGRRLSRYLSKWDPTSYSWRLLPWSYSSRSCRGCCRNRTASCERRGPLMSACPGLCSCLAFLSPAQQSLIDHVLDLITITNRTCIYVINYLIYIGFTYPWLCSYLSFLSPAIYIYIFVELSHTGFTHPTYKVILLNYSFI